ncbi:MAG: molybdopterin-binding protein [Campylobacterota bacterium]|nr:molybdopterin-binding protein [Campylobacterota bacterium]
MNFYAVIIGTEILNGRRQDRHFEFLKEALSKYGHTLFASFIIKDDPVLITSVFKMIKADENSVMFSFGGIGSTPDDLTRELASQVFTCKPAVLHKEFEKDIIERFADEAYPHRIHMAEIPEDSKLLKNPINNMSGFYLQNRFFFVPGFPEMAHTMVEEALETFYAHSTDTYRKTLIAQTSENTLIDAMKDVPNSVELSSLPMLRNNIPSVELSLISDNINEVIYYFEQFIDILVSKNIHYEIKGK